MMEISRVDCYNIWNQFLNSAGLFMKLHIWNTFMNNKVEFVQNKFRRNSEIPKFFRAANRDEPQRVNFLIEKLRSMLQTNIILKRYQ